jgi:hypothetical protein
MAPADYRREALLLEAAFFLNQINRYRRKSLPFLCTTAIPKGTASIYGNLISISFIRGFLYYGKRLRTFEPRQRKKVDSDVFFF